MCCAVCICVHLCVCVCVSVCARERVCLWMWLSGPAKMHTWHTTAVTEVPPEHAAAIQGGPTDRSTGNPLSHRDSHHHTHLPSPSRPLALSPYLVFHFSQCEVDCKNQRENRDDIAPRPDGCSGQPESVPLLSHCHVHPISCCTVAVDVSALWEKCHSLESWK
jgi:hypothetical protein